MNTLKAGERLDAGEELLSPSAESRLVLQPDGNLVVYRGTPSRANEVWATQTATDDPLRRPTYAEMTNDGEFVLRGQAGLKAWSSSTEQNPGAHLEIHDDGKLTIFSAVDGGELWAGIPEVPLPSAIGGATAVAVKAGEVGWGKRMVTIANLYRSGLLVVDSATMNDNWFGGLRGRTLIVLVDTQGNMIWTSQIFHDPTRCSIPDVSCASYGRVTHVEQFPAPVGEHAARIDIYHADEANFINLRDALIDGLKAVADVAAAVKAVWDQLQKSV